MWKKPFQRRQKSAKPNLRRRLLLPHLCLSPLRVKRRRTHSSVLKARRHNLHQRLPRTPAPSVPTTHLADLSPLGRQHPWLLPLLPKHLLQPKMTTGTSLLIKTLTSLTQRTKGTAVEPST